jgi:hypothetical protein
VWPPDVTAGNSNALSGGTLSGIGVAAAVVGAGSATVPTVALVLSVTGSGTSWSSVTTMPVGGATASPSLLTAPTVPRITPPIRGSGTARPTARPPGAMSTTKRMGKYSKVPVSSTLVTETE